MTVGTETRVVAYRGNGSAVSFSTGFPVINDTDLLVERRVYATQVVDLTYALGSDYTVTTTYPDQDATVALLVSALSNTYEILISRVVPFTQDLDMINQSGFYPETIEEQFDKVVMQIQQLNDAINIINGV